MFLVETLSFHLLPTPSSGAKRPPPWLRLHPPPAILHCSSLHPIPRTYVFRCSRAGVPSSLPPSASTQVPVNPWGEFPHHGSLRVSVSLPLPPPGLLLIFASSCPWSICWWIFTEMREARAPPLPGSCASWSSLPLLNTPWIFFCFCLFY